MHLAPDVPRIGHCHVNRPVFAAPMFRAFEKTSPLIMGVSVGGGFVFEGYRVTGVASFKLGLSRGVPGRGCFCGHFQLIVFRSAELGVVGRMGLHVILLKEPFVPMVAVVRVRRMGGLIGGKYLLSIVFRIDVPTLLVVLALQLLDVVAHITRDAVIVYLEQT